MSCLRVDQVVSLPLHLTPLAIAVPEHIQTMISVIEESLFVCRWSSEVSVSGTAK